MSRAVVALGANLGDRESSLRMAVSSLAALPGTRVAAYSHVYETDPVGYLDQPAFLNAAVLVETELSPAALHGRFAGDRGRGWGAGAPSATRLGWWIWICWRWRTERGVRYPVRQRSFCFPTPGCWSGRFVLAPLSDLFASGTACGVPFGDQWAAISRDGVRFFAAGKEFFKEI